MVSYGAKTLISQYLANLGIFCILVNNYYYLQVYCAIKEYFNKYLLIRLSWEVVEDIKINERRIPISGSDRSGFGIMFFSKSDST